MLEVILLLIVCTVIFLLFLPFLAICILVVAGLLGHSKQEPYKQTNNTDDLTEDSKDNSREDSEGDGLMLFDDTMFSEETD